MQAKRRLSEEDDVGETDPFLYGTVDVSLVIGIGSRFMEELEKNSLLRSKKDSVVDALRVKGYLTNEISVAIAGLSKTKGRGLLSGVVREECLRLAFMIKEDDVRRNVITRGPLGRKKETSTISDIHGWN
jgi:hypothetical protein